MTIPNKLSLFMFAMMSFASAWAQESGAAACPREDAEFAAVQKRADAKDPVAQTAMASCYDLGRHVQPNGKEAIRWLTQAANQGYGPAEYELGRIYLYGRGVPADYAQALQWERKAADQGDARAQRDLAFMYERGFGVPADPAQAMEWNRKAATQGQPDAQLHLARALQEGSGVQKNPGEARQWYAKAASREQPEAQLELARKLAQGPDCTKAIYWYKKAAAHGQSAAMYELGNFYLAPKCGPNREQAFTWFMIGARFGSHESNAAAGNLEKVLTAAGKKRAQLFAEQWIKQHPGSQQEEDDDEKAER
jgi:TPR repeat protein